MTIENQEEFMRNVAASEAIFTVFCMPAGKNGLYIEGNSDHIIHVVRSLFDARPDFYRIFRDAVMDKMMQDGERLFN